MREEITTRKLIAWCALFAAVLAMLVLPVVLAGEERYTSKDFRTVRDGITGASVRVCGKCRADDACGTFFNVADSCGYSCVNSITVAGGFVYVELCQGGDFRLTDYVLQSGACPFAPIPDGVRAHRYAVYLVDLLVFRGHADAIGGEIFQPWGGEFVCPSPTITSTPSPATPTSAPSPVATAPSVATASSVKPTATPTSAGSCPITGPFSDGACVDCHGTRVRCQGPLATPTPQPTAPAPTLTPTSTPAPSLTPSPRPPSPTWTPAPVASAPPPSPSFSPSATARPSPAITKSPAVTVTPTFTAGSTPVPKPGGGSASGSGCAGLAAVVFAAIGTFATGAWRKVVAFADRVTAFLSGYRTILSILIGKTLLLLNVVHVLHWTFDVQVAVDLVFDVAAIFFRLIASKAGPLAPPPAS